MPEQLEPFPPIACAHCGRSCGPSPRNPYIADGFRDTDTGEFSCWPCREQHYRKKAAGMYKKGGGMTYSEMPLPLTLI